mgnify:CR=1 FL=1
MRSSIKSGPTPKPSFEPVTIELVCESKQDLIDVYQRFNVSSGIINSIPSGSPWGKVVDSGTGVYYTCKAELIKRYGKNNTKKGY